MVDNELGLGVVFNGCIYNFRELRTELRNKGYRFFSHGDTEVILKAYHAWGPGCVRKFQGILRSRYGSAAAAGLSLREIALASSRSILPRGRASSALHPRFQLCLRPAG
jgi:glutamine phosphoribosylpyrophosphate amidotransferase